MRRFCPWIFGRRKAFCPARLSKTFNSCRRISVRFVVNALRVEAEKPVEIRAVSVKIGAITDSIVGDIVPYFGNFILNVAAHFPVVHADKSLSVGLDIAAVKLFREHSVHLLNAALVDIHFFHYSVKNGDLYKQDVITGNDVKVK